MVGVDLWPALAVAVIGYGLSMLVRGGWYLLRRWWQDRPSEPGDRPTD